MKLAVKSLNRSIALANNAGFGLFRQILIWFVIATLAMAIQSNATKADEGLLTPKQSEQVRVLVKETLLKNPSIVIEALQEFEARQEAAQNALVKKALMEDKFDLFGHPDDPVGGNPQGDVTLVEFFDYRCPYCKRVHGNVQKLLKTDGNIRFVYKEFPILGPASTFAARAALASRPQGKYVAFSNALMEAKGSYSESQVYGIAKEVGLDLTALKSELSSNIPAIDNVISRNISLARKLSITGTPAFVVGGEVVRGAIDYDSLTMLIAEARSRKTTKDGN